MVDEILDPTEEMVDALNHLLPQLRAELFTDLARLRASVEDPAVKILVARGAEGAIVGTLTLAFTTQLTGRRAWIHDVVVDADVRGEGHGREMVLDAIRRAREAGAASIRLTTNPSRTAAHRLYESVGFREHLTRVYDLSLG
ncbi:MAG: GNAT family N-acetyltransferase [Candidatus Dormibacteria bacterium]